MQRIRSSMICPKCGKKGFLTVRWVRSSYYPKYSSPRIILKKLNEIELMKDPSSKIAARSLKILKTVVSGFEYRKPSKRHLCGNVIEEKQQDKRLLFRTLSDKYYHLYIGHYDREKYQQKMKDYKDGKINWRPNGRRWCKVPFRWHGWHNDSVFKSHIDNYLKKNKKYTL